MVTDYNYLIYQGVSFFIVLGGYIEKEFDNVFVPELLRNCSGFDSIK